MGFNSEGRNIVLQEFHCNRLIYILFELYFYMVIVSSYYDFILVSQIKKRKQICLCFKYETGYKGVTIQFPGGGGGAVVFLK